MTQFEIKKKFAKIMILYGIAKCNQCNHFIRMVQEVYSFFRYSFLLTFKPNSKIAGCKTVRQRYIIFGRFTQNLKFILDEDNLNGCNGNAETQIKTYRKGNWSKYSFSINLISRQGDKNQSRNYKAHRIICCFNSLLKESLGFLRL